MGTNSSFTFKEFISVLSLFVMIACGVFTCIVCLFLLALFKAIILILIILFSLIVLIGNTFDSFEKPKRSRPYELDFTPQPPENKSNHFSKL